MPTPARPATAETGAFGSSTNTARAASKITASLRAASARRPLNGPRVFTSLMPQLYVERIAPFKYNGVERNNLFRKGSLWVEGRGAHGLEARVGSDTGHGCRRGEGLLHREGWFQR